ncbi:SdpI family protein [Pseudomonadota bacterium]
MKTKASKIFTVSLIASSFLISFYFFPKLPSQIPTHWNFQGNADQYSPKTFGVLFLPILQVGIYLLFQTLPLIDPKKKNYQLFKTEWIKIQIVILSFFTYMHFITLTAARNQNLNVSRYVFVGIGLLLVTLGYYLKDVKQNFFIGIRTPWTISNQKVWKNTHIFASKAYIITGLVTVCTSPFVLSINPAYIFLALLSGSLSPVLYSYYSYRQITQHNKK